MKLIPLTDMRGQLRSGAPLLWGVRDAQGNLLLGKGHVIASDDMLEALLARGMFVDAEEAKAGRGEAVAPPPMTLRPAGMRCRTASRTSCAPRATSTFYSASASVCRSLRRWASEVPTN